MAYEHKWLSPAEVIRVVDGDTIEVILDLGYDTYRKEVIRFRRINAYEVKMYKGVTAAQKKKGIAGKEFLKGLIEGKRAYIRTYKEKTRGSLRRYLGEVYVLSAGTPLVKTADIKALRMSKDETSERSAAKIINLHNVNDLMVDLGFAVYKKY